MTDVLAFGHCTPVPGAKRELLGVINLRGEIRAVVSLARLLELPEGDREGSGGFIAMLRCGAAHVGFQVDRVENIAAATVTAAANGAEVSSQLPGRYVRGMTVDGTILLDIPALFQHAALRDESPVADHGPEAK